MFTPEPASLPRATLLLFILTAGKELREYLVTLSDDRSCACQLPFYICMSVLIISKHMILHLCIKKNT